MQEHTRECETTQRSRTSRLVYAVSRRPLGFSAQKGRYSNNGHLDEKAMCVVNATRQIDEQGDGHESGACGARNSSRSYDISLTPPDKTAVLRREYLRFCNYFLFASSFINMEFLGLKEHMRL